MFQLNRLSAAVFASLTSATALPAFAQGDTSVVEEILVTGIRASAQASMDIKRDSAGVVDAISAEEIGKFPDTNLAESLQRITGVSISRTNGEGSEITVRGFGPDFNMVTLNGRNMPGGSTYGGGSGADGTTRGGSARAFDFGNLASEAVSSVEVYKTGKASISTGGIGATVNIKTTRPLDNSGFKATIGAKAVSDTTNRIGRDVTPELSGLISWADDQSVFGAALSASHQERDSGYTGATVNDWNIGVWGEDDLFNRNRNFDDPVFNSAPEQGQLYTRPNDIRYAFSDSQRTRTNSQLTLQFAPTDTVTGTMDFTFAKNEIEEHRGELTNWVQNGDNLSRVVFDQSDVATPVIIEENYNGGWKDQGYEQQYRSQENTLRSFGINLDYAATDSLSFNLDVHDSTMESLPSGPGGTGELSVGLGSPTKTAKGLYFNDSLPYFTHVIDDCLHANAPNNEDKEFVTNCNGALDVGDVSSSVMRNWAAEQVSDVTQLRLDGQLEFDNGRFDFGVEHRDMSSNTKSYNGNNAQVLGGWGADNPGEFPAGLIEPFDLVGEFDDYSTSNAPNVGFRADARDLANHLVQAEQYADAKPFIGLEDNNLSATRNSVNIDNTVEEKTMAAYFQLSLQGSLGDFPTRLLTGLRYENTEVESNSRVEPVQYLTWQSDNDFSAVSGGETQLLSESFSYDNLLPNMDFDISFTDQLTGRFSYSKTIARAGLGSLAAASSGFGTNGATLNGAKPSANVSNPRLLPLESNNFDLTLEWYFDDTSYISTGLWEKRVNNFVGTGQEDRTHFEIRDQTNGPRAIAARQALEDGSFPVDDNTLHTMMVILDNPGDFPNGAAEFDNSATQISDLGENDSGDYDILPNDDDPLMVFQTSLPVNNKEAKIYGLEFAMQHFFGDTGLGFLANYTLVRGDVQYDNLASPDVQQFALLGLSDTANLVLMYDNYGVQARLAYNWRDKYLNRSNYRSGNNPGYVEAYSQIDVNVSYDITDSFTLSIEGINITGEDSREHARNKNMLWYLEDLGARYQLGARYTF